MSVALFLELANYEGKNVHQDVLLEHIEDVQSLLKRCESLKNYDAKSTKSISTAIREQYSYLFKELNYRLWDLFALSVCSDHLLWRCQNGELTLAEYSRFFTEVGMQVLSIDQSYYHPFYHEIYYVDDETKLGEQQQIVIKEKLYPMIMFGDLQFSRAGVIIYNHPSIDKNVAENSEMYFANRRANRSCQDLSHGWGSNSRWRTEFVRNYETANEWKFNVDGKVDLSNVEEYKQHYQQYDEEVPVTISEAKELLVNRHFVHQNNISQELQSDLFPYEWRINIVKEDFNYVQWQKRFL